MPSASPSAPAPESLPAVSDAVPEDLPEEIRTIVDSLATKVPPSPDVLFARGQILDLYGQGDAAIQFWKDCLAIEPGFARAEERIGQVLIHSGKFEEAIASLERAERLDPDLPDVRLHLAKALYHLGRIDEAEPILQRQTTLHPQSIEAWFRLGQVYLERDEYERSRQCFQKVLDIYPESQPAWFGLAQVWTELKNDEEAARCRERLLALEREKTEAERTRRQGVNLGRSDDRETLSQACTIAADVFAANGLYSDAEGCLRLATEADADDVQCRLRLGRLYVRMNRPADAILVLEELVKLQPRQVDHRLDLAALHEQLQQFEAAERCYNKALEIAPDDVRALAGLARICLSSGQRIAEAQRLAQRIVQLQPTAQHYYFLSSICRANRDRAGALTALQEAIRLDPDNPAYAAAAEAVQ
jgi:tetratricopeptide (TPR) repeat protein